MNNKFVLIVLIASLGFNAYFVVKALEGKTDEDSVHETNQPSKSLEREKDAILSTEELVKNKNSDNIKVSSETEAKELEAKIAQLKLQLEKLKDKKVRVGFSDDINDSEVAKAIGASSDAMKRFEKEAIDYAWSNDTKNKLDQVFVDNALNSEMQIKDMECKTSVCKLSVSPYAGSSQGHLMGAGMRVLEAISESGQEELAGLKTTFNVDTDKEQIDIFLYNSQ